MGFRVRLSPRASRELVDLYWRVAKEAPSRGQDWYRSIIEAIDSLRGNPFRCPLAPDPALRKDGVRCLLYGAKRNRYRILFRVPEGQQTVDILRVRHVGMKYLA